MSPGTSTAIALFGYNRPHYFQKCIASLVENPEARELPVYAFLDGGPGSKQSQYADILKHPLPAAILRLREVNHGCGRSLIRGRQELFDKEGFDRVVVVEDDVLVAPQYVRLLFNLADWAERNYEEVGVVSAFRSNHLTLEEKRASRDLVVAENTNWISYLMLRRGWMGIRDQLQEYLNTFLEGREYRTRSMSAIARYFAQLISSARARRGSPQLPDSAYVGWQTMVSRYRKPPFPNGQDACTAMALFHAGYVKLSLYVNRCLHIGTHGIHSRPTHMGTQSLNKMTLDIFPEDRDLKEFRCS